MAIAYGSNAVAARVGEVAGFYGSMAEELTCLFKRSSDVAWVSDMPVRAKSRPKPSTGRLPSSSTLVARLPPQYSLRSHYMEEPRFVATQEARQPKTTPGKPPSPTAATPQQRRGPQPRSKALASRSAGRAGGRRLQLGEDRFKDFPQHTELTPQHRPSPRVSLLAAQGASEALLEPAVVQSAAPSPRNVGLQTSLTDTAAIATAQRGTEQKLSASLTREDVAEKKSAARLLSVSDLQLVLPQEVTASTPPPAPPALIPHPAAEAVARPALPPSPAPRLGRPAIRSVIAEILTEEIKYDAPAEEACPQAAAEDSVRPASVVAAPVPPASQDSRLDRVEGVLLSQAEASAQQMQAMSQMQTQTLAQLDALLQFQSQAQAERMELAALARALQSPEPSTDATVEFANKALELQKLATESTKEVIERLARVAEQNHEGLAEQVAASVAEVVRQTEPGTTHPPRPTLGELFAGVREILAEWRSTSAYPAQVSPSRDRPLPMSPSMVSAACSAMRATLPTPSSMAAHTSLRLETEPPVETEERLEELTDEPPQDEDTQVLAERTLPWTELQRLLQAFNGVAGQRAASASTTSSSGLADDSSVASSCSALSQTSEQSPGEVRWTEFFAEMASPGELLTPVTGSNGEASLSAAFSAGEANSAGEMPGKVQSSIGQLSDRDSAVALSSNGQVDDDMASVGEAPSVGQVEHSWSRQGKRACTPWVSTVLSPGSGPGSSGEVDAGEVLLTEDVSSMRHPMQQGGLSDSIGEASSEGLVRDVHGAEGADASVGEVSRAMSADEDASSAGRS
mmetsp:Transcript_50501/g.117889  ORF Transcript_50501/g.117889 Transcript_50501/m.117889 type:complete len:800 (-) Transcript_50501:116-2515(-)